MEFFPQKFVPHSTTDLITVTYHKTHKVVTNVFQEKSYLLYQCGTEPPADEIESGNHHLVLSVPHTGGIAITETPQIPPIELLAKRSEIKAIFGNPKLVSSPCLTHMMSEETVKSIHFPDEAWNNNTLLDMSTADYLEEYPDAIVFVGPTGKKEGVRRWAVAASQERTAAATFDWVRLHF